MPIPVEVPQLHLLDSVLNHGEVRTFQGGTYDPGQGRGGMVWSEKKVGVIFKKNIRMF